MDRICRIRKGSFNMKNLKGVKENPGTPLSAAALGISPLATNPANAGSEKAVQNVKNVTGDW